MFGGGGIICSYPVTGAHQKVLLLRGNILGPGFSNEELWKLPKDTKLAGYLGIIFNHSFDIQNFTFLDKRKS